MTSKVLLQSLLKPEAYDHPTESIRYTQTHLSYVLLTGEHAYKLKKAVNLGFQDFTSLAKRKYYCELECELNKTLAPNLYEGVVPITGTEEAPKIGGDGPVIEWAIKMHQFPEEHLLINVLSNGALSLGMVDSLAKQAATFHQQIPISWDGLYGTPQKLHKPVMVNFEQLRRLLSDPSDLATIDTIDIWANRQFTQLQSCFSQRKANGFTRSCHGDMHLGNSVLLNGVPTIFDCIEFNEDFRWTDVMRDVAFMAMDLTLNDRADLANYFVNRYMEYTGDYTGLPVLRYYMSYNAMVRAKVAAFMMEQNAENAEFSAGCLKTCRAYLQLAKRLCHPPKTNLLITYGISGSGKSTITEQHMMETGAVRLRSDIERKRLHSVDLFKPTPENKKELLYHKEASRKTFDHLYQIAETLLSAQLPVIVDAAFLRQEERARFQALAARLDIPFQILTFPIPSDEVLEARFRQRAEKLEEASDATYTVAMAQKQYLEPLSDEELLQSICATSMVFD